MRGPLYKHRTTRERVAWDPRWTAWRDLEQEEAVQELFLFEKNLLTSCPPVERRRAQRDGVSSADTRWLLTRTATTRRFRRACESFARSRSPTWGGRRGRRSPSPTTRFARRSRRG